MPKLQTESTYSDVTKDLNPGLPNNLITGRIQQLAQKTLDARQNWQQSQQPENNAALQFQASKPEDDLYQQSKQLFIDKLQSKALTEAQFDKALSLGLPQLIANSSISEADETALELAEAAFEVVVDYAQNNHANHEEQDFLRRLQGLGPKSDDDELSEEERMAADVEGDQEHYSPSM